jgi:mono/diheme cytochrome c family protein
MDVALARRDLLMAGQGVSSDRLWFWFAISSAAFLGVLAISPAKDYLREYRTHQERYRGLLLETAGSAAEVRKARSVAVAIRQIWLPAFEGRVDRCVTCHLGVENPRMAQAPQPFRSHPATPHAPEHFQRFGCVACHRGQGRATSLAEAHGDAPDWESPLLPRELTEASCGRCHLGDTVPEASLLSEGRALVRRAGCFGCHKVNGTDDWSSDAPDLNGLSLKTGPEWLRAWLRAPRDLQPNTLMPDFGLAKRRSRPWSRSSGPGRLPRPRHWGRRTGRPFREIPCAGGRCSASRAAFPATRSRGGGTGARPNSPPSDPRWGAGG